MKKLEGKVAIVTGAAQGIGFAVARRFVEEGALVVVCDINSMKLDDAAERLTEIDPRTLHQICDVTSAKQIDEFVGNIVERTGRVDILVNNAAVFPPQVALQDVDETDYLNTIDGCLNSTYRFMQRVFPEMKDRGGKIINFTSMAGIRGTKRAGAYAVAKAGIIGLTKVAANDWGKYGITVNCVAPMAMNDSWAAFMNTLPEGTSPTEAIKVRPTAVGFVGDAEKHIAPIVSFLASDDSNYLTGSVIPADGGVTDVETK